MPDAHILVGTPQRRVDGRAKVTGAATYAGGFTAPGLLHGYVVCSATAKDRITHIDTGAALAVSAVVQVFMHLNQTKTRTVINPPPKPHGNAAAAPAEAAVRDGSGNLHWVDEWSFCLTVARMAAEQERR